MSGKKVAVVTGSNKGIGYAIVRGLCKQFEGDVYLTARDKDRGEAAVNALKAEGLNPLFHQLDIDDTASIDNLAQDIKAQYGGLDILVNNAGMAYKNASTAPFSEQAEVTVKTNYTGTVNVCNKLFPLLRSHSRVVNVSSMGSQFALNKCSAERKKQALGLKSVQEIDAFLQEFVDAAQSGKHEAEGFPNSAYGMSKVGVTALSIVQQQQIDADTTRSDIIVNACCPGYVDTDMSSHKGPKTIDQGADTPLYLAVLPANCSSPRGKFVSERKIGQWE